MQHGRRQALRSMAMFGAAGLLPGPIARALALPAIGRTGTIADVAHVVILMQENRSFDHYFGTLRGVRGFGDPRPAPLPRGGDVFRQPAADGSLAPFHLDSRTTSAPVMESLDHSWKGDAAEWARYDCWVRRKSPLCMGQFRRDDVPFYHALADAFTIGDAYHCSIHGPTGPNRLFLFSGTSGLGAGDTGRQVAENIDDGNWTGDSRRDDPTFKGFGWTTYPERLERAGIDWKVYQEHDNFGDNPLASFAAFRGLPDDHPLHRRGRATVPGSDAANAGTTRAQPLVDAFAADVAAGRLPQVSWIVAPEAYSEHPKAPPAYGESLTARLLDALTANPEVWGRTVFILNYDENDGFFDHMPPPIPAAGTPGEVYRGQPVGLGPRVPLLVVSPWTRGGWVNSQVFDHTSVIRFLERRFGVAEPNITPWRRAVTGDLTSLFDFAEPDASAVAGLAIGDAYLERVAAASRRPPPHVPSAQALPRQEPGRRPARALPYDLAVDGEPAPGGGLLLTVANAGCAGAVLAVYAPGTGAGPWHHLVEAGQRARIPIAAPQGPFVAEVHGPNGFLRAFSFPAGPDETLKVEARTSGETLLIALANRGRQPAAIEIRPGVYGGTTGRLVLRPGDVRSIRWRTADTDGWYDVEITHGEAAVSYRFAGHIETGRPSRSDPALGRTNPESAKYIA